LLQLIEESKLCFQFSHEPHIEVITLKLIPSTHYFLTSIQLQYTFFLCYSQTVHLLLSRLTDGAARIYSYHRGRDLNSHQQACNTLWDLNLGPLNQLSYRDRGIYMKLNILCVKTNIKQK